MVPMSPQSAQCERRRDSLTAVRIVLSCSVLLRVSGCMRYQRALWYANLHPQDKHMERATMRVARVCVRMCAMQEPRPTHTELFALSAHPPTHRLRPRRNERRGTAVTSSAARSKSCSASYAASTLQDIPLWTSALHDSALRCLGYALAWSPSSHQLGNCAYSLQVCLRARATRDAGFLRGVGTREWARAHPYASTNGWSVQASSATQVPVR